MFTVRLLKKTPLGLWSMSHFEISTEQIYNGHEETRRYKKYYQRTMKKVGMTQDESYCLQPQWPGLKTVTLGFSFSPNRPCCTRSCNRVPNLTGNYVNNLLPHHTRVNARSHKQPHKKIKLLLYQPWYSTGFHAVSKCDVIWPSIKLPLNLPQDSGEHRSCMDSNAHI